MMLPDCTEKIYLRSGADSMKRTTEYIREHNIIVDKRIETRNQTGKYPSHDKE